MVDLSPAEIANLARKFVRNNHELIIFSAAASNGVYSDSAPPHLRPTPPPHIPFTLKPITVGASQADVIHPNDPNKPATVAIRGSANLQNWIDNLSILPARDKDLKQFTTKGHNNVINSKEKTDEATFQEQIFNAIGDRDVVFTGHSMGGAVAGILAAKYKQAHPDKDVKLITFSGASTGPFPLKEIRNIIGVENAFHYIDERDPVPLVMTGSHVGSIVVKKKDGSFYADYRSESDIIPRIPQNVLGVARGLPTVMETHPINSESIQNMVGGFKNDESIIQEKPASFVSQVADFFTPQQTPTQKTAKPPTSSPFR